MLSKLFLVSGYRAILISRAKQDNRQTIVAGPVAQGGDYGNDDPFHEGFGEPVQQAVSNIHHIIGVVGELADGVVFQRTNIQVQGERAPVSGTRVLSAVSVVVIGQLNW